MNPAWRILEEHGLDGPEHLQRELVSKLRRTFKTQAEAEVEAERLARGNPGRRYSVYEFVSAYIVDGLTREVPDNLIDVAKKRAECIGEPFEP